MVIAITNYKLAGSHLRASFLLPLAKTYIYEYNDNAGNLTAVKAYNYTTGDLSGTPATTAFDYDRDKLTSFGGATIAYNAIGCPTTYEGKSLGWTKGKLTNMSKGSRAEGLEGYSFSYNAYGQRVSKSYSYLPGTSSLNPIYVGQTLTANKQFYYDHSGRLVAETFSGTYYNADARNEKIVFLYDGNTVIGMQHTVNGVTTPYYFHRNPLGDVVGIYNTNGTQIAKYIYDAWGNCTISGNTTVAKANPIRYRGYYYDEDTGLYYCNARYYSPKWRRFISPDDTAYLDPSSVNGLNQYCYCGNDPVNASAVAFNDTNVASMNAVHFSKTAAKTSGSINQFHLPRMSWLINNATTLYGTYSALSAGIPIFAHYFRYAKTIGDEFRLYGLSKWRTSLQLSNVDLRMTKLDGMFLGINVGLDFYDSIQRGVSPGGVFLGAGLTAASGVVTLYLNKGIMWACTTVGTAISPGAGTAVGFVVGLAASITVDWLLGNWIADWIDSVAT